MRRLASYVSISFLLLLTAYTPGKRALLSAGRNTGRAVWDRQKAAAWYAEKPWLRGCDFIPSTAINQLEMWQAGTFDTATIDRELGYAQSIGLNCMRVFLHHAAWQEDRAGFKRRVGQYLGIAARRGVVTIFVFFDDCWNESYRTGPQPPPKPGVHNSGWLRDPGKLLYTDPSIVGLLGEYVKDMLTTFKDDRRILLWDLYNEPGNSDYGSKSLPLLKRIFRWGREVDPSQPLSSGVWNDRLPELNAFQLSNSDIITYHDYEPAPAHRRCIDSLRPYGRPLICTEYMARPRNSSFFTIMPLLKSEHVGAINWGLVTGKTNTKYAWDMPMPDGSEPPIWFHDIFRPDGTPFDQRETSFIASVTRQ
jgi:hypothetical protein